MRESLSKEGSPLGFIVAGHIQISAAMTLGMTHSSQPSHFPSSVAISNLPNIELAPTGLGTEGQRWGLSALFSALTNYLFKQ